MTSNLTEPLLFMAATRRKLSFFSRTITLAKDWFSCPQTLSLVTHLLIAISSRQKTSQPAWMALAKLVQYSFLRSMSLGVFLRELMSLSFIFRIFFSWHNLMRLAYPALEMAPLGSTRWQRGSLSAISVASTTDKKGFSYSILKRTSSLSSVSLLGPKLLSVLAPFFMFSSTLTRVGSSSHFLQRVQMLVRPQPCQSANFFIEGRVVPISDFSEYELKQFLAICRNCKVISFFGWVFFLGGGGLSESTISETAEDLLELYSRLCLFSGFAVVRGQLLLVFSSSSQSQSISRFQSSSSCNMSSSSWFQSSVLIETEDSEFG